MFCKSATTGLKVMAALVALSFSPLAASEPSSSVILSKYCVTCHNEKLKTAGFVLNPEGVAHAGADAEIWEKVVRKLRTNAMPPAGVPRPDQATIDSVASFLESELDRAAAAKPNPGKLPLMHRISRTEY